MGLQTTVNKQYLFRVVKEAIISATHKRTGISTVRLATEFNTDYHVIEASLDELVNEGSIVREYKQQGSSLTIYSLPGGVLPSTQRAGIVTNFRKGVDVNNGRTNTDR